MTTRKGNAVSLNLIKDIVGSNWINTKDLETISGIDYPLFSFRWLQKHSFDECRDEKFFHAFLIRLQKLSLLGWYGIRTSGRHQYGMEKIPLRQLKPTNFPKIVTPEVEELDVFRAVGDNRPMVGLQQGKIFHVIYIEANFGDVYRHRYALSRGWRLTIPG